MTAISLPTFFAPAERVNQDVLRTQNSKVARLGLVSVLLDSFPEGAVILNAQRQIVYANDKVASFLAVSRDALVGVRLGEALGCIHAHEPPSGCGTTESCRHCGAAQAMETSRLNQSKELKECRILCSGPSACPALELKVAASPLELEGEWFTILALRDIGDEKRRELLERIFFHDVINLAGGLRGVLDQLPDLSGAEAVEFERLAVSQAEQLIEEIECQRDLSAAERGDLAVHVKPVLIRELLDRLCFLYRHHPVGVGKTLVVAADPGADIVSTDPILLRRVLGNLIKNALEASPLGATVTLNYSLSPQGHVFAVNNSTVMDDAVRAQIFQRTFSTKAGKGRGLGSYSVKLLTERHLQGRVEFESRPGPGTTFRVVLPVVPSVTPGPTAEPRQAASTPADSEANDTAPAGMRILLAEDSIINQRLVKAMLRKNGMQVQVVANGKEAVEAVRTQPFDAVLMDAEMPEMNGLEAAEAIRTLERQTGGHVPIIALTAHTSEEHRRQCRDAGMDEYVTKPLAAAEMLAALKRLRPASAVQSGSHVAELIGDTLAPALSPAAVARLRDLVGSTPGILAELAATFIQDAVDRLGKLRQALDAHDSDRIQKNAHALKGACLEFGAQGMIPICQQLETLGAAHSVAGAAEMVGQLEKESRRACAAAAALQAEGTP